MSGAIPSLDPTRLAPKPGSRMAVVGGCGGIGRELVIQALEAGIEVAVLDLPGSMEAHPPPQGVAGYPIDATQEDQVAGAFGKIENDWGSLDVLVSLAGFTNEKVPVGELPIDEWDEIIAGNLRAAYLGCRAALPLLKASGDGRIVNMASGLGLRLLPGYGAYGASKAGVVAMTKALAVENAPTVRANAVAPGPIDTAFLRGGTGREGRGPGQDFDAGTFSKLIPIGRIGVPDDVVGPILFLAGDASRYMTGQVLYINGGSLTP